LPTLMLVLKKSKKTVNITIKGKHSTILTYIETCKNEYLQFTYELWESVFWILWIMWFFPRRYKYRNQ